MSAMRTGDAIFSYCHETICHRVYDFAPTGVNLEKFGIFRVSFEAKGSREEREKGVFIVLRCARIYPLDK